MYSVRDYRAVSSPEEAAALLKEGNSAVIGGGLWLRQGNGKYDTLIDLTNAGLDKLEEEDGVLTLGSMMTLRQIECSGRLAELGSGILAEAVKPIVGVQFRNMATLGGSLYARLGFSDVAAALLVLDPLVILQEAGAMPLSYFLAGPPKKDVLVSVKIRDDGRKAAYETLRATKTDTGILNLALAACPGGKWRVSVGARPGIAMRCADAEEELEGGRFDRACRAVAELPYGDTHRASGEYRREMSRVLLERAYARLKGGNA